MLSLRPVAVVLLMSTAPAEAVTTFCVDTTSEIRNTLALAQQIDDNVVIRIERGTYLLTSPITYSGNFSHRMTLIGGYDNGCSSRTSAAEDTVLFYPNPSAAATLGLGLRLSTWNQVTVKFLTFSGLDELHILLKGDGAAVTVDSNRFERGGGLVLDAHAVQGVAARNNTMEVFNNVFLETYAGTGVTLRTGQDGFVRVLYNTIVRSAGDNLFLENRFGANLVEVANNIFQRGDNVHDVIFSGIAGFAFVHNVFDDFLLLDPCPDDGGLISVCFVSSPVASFEDFDARLDEQGRPRHGSVAINNGEHTSTPPRAPFDAHGILRPLGGRSDIGAYETE